MNILEIAKKASESKKLVDGIQNYVGGEFKIKPFFPEGEYIGYIKNSTYLETASYTALDLEIEFNVDGVVKSIKKRLFVDHRSESEYSKTLKRLLSVYTPSEAFDSNALIGEMVNVRIKDRPYREGFVSSIDEILSKYVMQPQDVAI